MRSSEAKTPLLPSKREAYLFPALRRTVTSFSSLIFTITEVALVFFVVREKMKLERFSHLSQASFPGSSLWAAMCPTPVPRLSPGPAWARKGRWDVRCKVGRDGPPAAPRRLGVRVDEPTAGGDRVLLTGCSWRAGAPALRGHVADISTSSGSGTRKTCFPFPSSPRPPPHRLCSSRCRAGSHSTHGHQAPLLRPATTQAQQPGLLLPECHLEVSAESWGP